MVVAYNAILISLSLRLEIKHRKYRVSRKTEEWVIAT